MWYLDVIKTAILKVHITDSAVSTRVYPLITLFYIFCFLFSLQLIIAIMVATAAIFSKLIFLNNKNQSIEKEPFNILLTTSNKLCRKNMELDTTIFCSVLLRLRVEQKALQWPLLSSFFSTAILDGLAKVIFKFFSNCCYKRAWPGSQLLIWNAVCFQTMSFRDEQ